MKSIAMLCLGIGCAVSCAAAKEPRSEERIQPESKPVRLASLYDPAPVSRVVKGKVQAFDASGKPTPPRADDPLCPHADVVLGKNSTAEFVYEGKPIGTFKHWRFQDGAQSSARERDVKLTIANSDCRHRELPFAIIVPTGTLIVGNRKIGHFSGFEVAGALAGSQAFLAHNSIRLAKATRAGQPKREALVSEEGGRERPDLPDREHNTPDTKDVPEPREHTEPGDQGVGDAITDIIVDTVESGVEAGAAAAAAVTIIFTPSKIGCGEGEQCN